MHPSPVPRFKTQLTGLELLERNPHIKLRHVELGIHSSKLYLQHLAVWTRSLLGTKMKMVSEQTFWTSGLKSKPINFPITKGILEKIIQTGRFIKKLEQTTQKKKAMVQRQKRCAIPLRKLFAKIFSPWAFILPLIWIGCII